MGAANADSIYARSIRRQHHLHEGVRTDELTLLDGGGLSPEKRHKIDRKQDDQVIRSIGKSKINRHVRRPNHCKLYRKFNCSRITFPLNSAGNGGNGFEALMPATAARSRASAPEGTAITSLGTVPSLLIAN